MVRLWSDYGTDVRKTFARQMNKTMVGLWYRLSQDIRKTDE